jgi:hypothetical protein
MLGLPASQYFDLDQPFRDLQRGRPLRETRRAKPDFAFDIVNARLFAAQLSAPGHDDPVGFEPAARRERSSTSCAIDPVHEHVAVRRNEHGRIWYTVYDLSHARANFGATLARFPQPTLSDGSVTFLGYAIHGQYLYTLDRTGPANGSDINAYVSRIDMNTGRVQRRSRVWIPASLIFREPEGIAIYRTCDGRLRLFIGLGSRTSLDGPKRYTNLYYNDVLRAA